MTPDRLQPSLFPTEAYIKKELEAKPPLFILLIDSTPSYDTSLIYEWCDSILKGHEHDISFPDKPITPANLLDAPNIQELKIFVQTHQRMLEATGIKTIHPGISVIFETPVSPIAWVLFRKEISGPSEKDKVLIEASKDLLQTVGKNLDSVPSLHLVRLVSSERLRGSLTHFSNEEVAILEKRIKIFNGCLKTAAKISSRCLPGVQQVITD